MVPRQVVQPHIGWSLGLWVEGQSVHWARRSDLGVLAEEASLDDRMRECSIHGALGRLARRAVYERFAVHAHGVLWIEGDQDVGLSSPQPQSQCDVV
jgi:hypothetical protein